MCEGLSESSADAQMTRRRLDQRELSAREREAPASMRTASQRPNCSGSECDTGVEKSHRQEQMYIHHAAIIIEDPAAGQTVLRSSPATIAHVSIHS